MLGQLVFSADGRERAERHDLYGLGVLQVRVRPGGWRRDGCAAAESGWLKAECGESWFHGALTSGLCWSAGG